MKLSRLLLVFTLMLTASIAHAEQRGNDRQIVSGPRTEWQAVVDAVALTGHQDAAADMEAALSAMTDEELFLGFGQMDLTGLAEAFLDVSESFDAVKERYPETSIFLDNQKFKSSNKKVKTGNPVLMSAGLPPAVGYPGLICPISPERSNADDLLIAVSAIAAGNIALEIANGIWSVADRACGTVVVAIGIGGNPQNALCIITDVVLFVAQAVVTTAEAVTDGIAFCDGAVDSAEIEGAYERVGHIHADLETHDSNIDADLAAHDVNIDTDLIAHNLNIVTNLAAHDLNIDTDLAAHDLNIDTDLIAHDLNIDTDLQIHDADIKLLLDGVQETLDEKVELRRVHMQVLQVSMRKRYLVSTNEAGIAVSVDFTSVEVFNDKTASFEIIPNATVTELSPGMYDLQLNLDSESPDKVFRLRVRHDELFDHFGEILFHRTTSDSSN